MHRKRLEDRKKIEQSKENNDMYNRNVDFADDSSSEHNQSEFTRKLSPFFIKFFSKYNFHVYKYNVQFKKPTTSTEEIYEPVSLTYSPQSTE